MHMLIGLQRMCVLRRNSVKKNRLLFANMYKARTAFPCIRIENLSTRVSMKKEDNKQEEPIIRLQCRDGEKKGD